MDTLGLGAGSYPEPSDPKEHTIRLKLYVESIVTVYGDDEERWYEQINDLSEREKLETIDELEIEEYERID